MSDSSSDLPFLDVPPERLDAALKASFESETGVSDSSIEAHRSILPLLDDGARVQLHQPSATISPPNTPWQSTTSQHYELISEIARGGMGTVYWARDTKLGRELAIKVLHDEFRNRPGALERFVEEAQIAAQLQHPGLVPVHEMGEFDDGRPYFTMNLVKGRTLAQLLAMRKGNLSARGHLLGVFEKICQTLAYAHAQGVVHRDLKPANVMVGSFGEVQVVDWGLAKVLSRNQVSGDGNRVADQDQLPDDDADSASRRSTSESVDQGTVLGTPAYSSPEQAFGDQKAVRETSDVFGLGAILCEILTGAPPYTGRNVRQQAEQAAVEDAYRRLDECDVDEQLRRFAKRCLSPEPLDRPAHAGIVAEEMKAYLVSVQERLYQTEMENVEIRTKAMQERKLRRMTIALAVSTLLVVLAGFVGTNWWSRIQQERALRAEVLQTYYERLERAARLGWWTEATHNFSEALRLAPENRRSAFAYAPLLLQTGDFNGYRQHCHALIDHHRGTKNVHFADQLAKACLLSRSNAVPREEVAKFVQTAISDGPSHRQHEFFLLLKGLYAYRNGDFKDAIADCQRSRLENDGPNENISLTATDFAVEAMALYQLGRLDESRTALNDAKTIVDERFGHSAQFDLGENWPNWLIAKILCQEAEAQINGLLETSGHEEFESKGENVRYPQELAIARISQHYVEKGSRHGQAGRWAEAAHCYSDALALVPGDQSSAFRLAPLLVEIGEMDGYRQHCQMMLAHWKDTDNVFFADQAAKACLLTPERIASQPQLVQLVKTAMSAGPRHSEFKFFALVEGLHNYREGKFGEAVKACQTSRNHNQPPNANIYAMATAYTVEAMSQQQLAKTKFAQKSLAMARQIINQQFPPSDTGELGNAWHDWLIAHILFREATETLHSTPAVDAQAADN